jgi:hypothetical protein
MVDRTKNNTDTWDYSGSKFEKVFGKEAVDKIAGFVGREDKLNTHEMKKVNDVSIRGRQLRGEDSEYIAVASDKPKKTDSQVMNVEILSNQVQEREAYIKERAEQYGEAGEAAIRAFTVKLSRLSESDPYAFEDSYKEVMSSLEKAHLSKDQEMNAYMEVESIFKEYYDTLPDRDQRWMYDFLSAHEQKVNSMMNKKGRNPVEWIVKFFNRNR